MKVFMAQKVVAQRSLTIFTSYSLENNRIKGTKNFIMCETSLLERFLPINSIKEVNIAVGRQQTDGVVLRCWSECRKEAESQWQGPGCWLRPPDCISIIAGRKHLFFIGPQLKRHFYGEPVKNLSSVWQSHPSCNLNILQSVHRQPPVCGPDLNTWGHSL